MLPPALCLGRHGLSLHGIHARQPSYALLVKLHRLRVVGSVVHEAA